jgi:exodeoxyribonuclease-3
MSLRLYSWNVNGFRAVLGKGFRDWFGRAAPDVLGLQEVKALEEQAGPERLFDGYSCFWNAARVKKGYSGTACYTRAAPLSVHRGLPDPRFQGEGRVIRLEFQDFHFFNIYFPNGQMSQDRLDYKLGFYDAFLAHAQELRRSKPIVVCGDFNTAHREIDLKNPKANETTSGFLPIERAWMDRFMDHGYLDTFRLCNGDVQDAYSWWTYRFGARSRNVGWRIDYFFVSAELRPAVRAAWIDADVPGSDHCPVGLELDLPQREHPSDKEKRCEQT